MARQKKRRTAGALERVRLTFETDVATQQQLCDLADAEKCSMSEIVRLAVVDYFAARADADARSRLPGGESETERQERFLEALTVKNGIQSARKMAGVTVEEVRRWMSSPEFQDRANTAHEEYIEEQEQLLIELASGQRKGNVLAAITYLNAHNANYGRMRAESIARVVASLLEKFYKVLNAKISPELADECIEACRDIAERKMLSYGD